jgi:molybdopterin-synthase adenylyltransferase
MLSPEEKRKYIRQIMLPGIGLEGQEKICNAKVAVIGCGGLGCPVILYLASAGVGTIGLVDFDTVHITNLHRQVLFGEADVGHKKVEVAEYKIRQLHPRANIVVHDVMLDASNAESVISGYDLVIDGCDNFETRYIVNDACVKLNKPLVYGSILGFEGQVAVFNLNGSKHLRDLFPEPPNAEDVPDCSENGVLATVPGIVGTIMANECMKVLIGKSTLNDKFLLFNCLDAELNVLHY